MQSALHSLTNATNYGTIYTKKALKGDDLTAQAQISMFGNSTSPIIHFPTHTPTRIPHKAQPITDRQVLEAVKSKLLTSTGRYGLRNYTIFVLALNTGLRMNDILTVHLSDVWDFASNTLKPVIALRESKTNKVADNITLSPQVQSILTDYILSIRNPTPNTPLFPSQKTTPKKLTHSTVYDLHGNTLATSTHRKNDTGCMERKSYWRILHNISTQLGVQVSCHTPRKTFARAIYDQFKGSLVENQFSALDLVQQMLRHSNSETTLRYIGITDEIHQAVYKGMNL